MNGKKAKLLRRQAEKQTIGLEPEYTKARYKELKKQYKAVK